MPIKKTTHAFESAIENATFYREQKKAAFRDLVDYARTLEQENAELRKAINDANLPGLIDVPTPSYLLTMDEAAEMLGISAPAFSSYARYNKLAFTKKGRAHFFNYETIDELKGCADLPKPRKRRV